MEFEGYADPVLNDFRINKLDPPTPTDQNFLPHSNEYGLSGNWGMCIPPEVSNNGPPNNPENSVELYTVPNSIGQDNQCGDNPLYEIQGAFCTMVDLSWFGSTVLTNVYAEITILNPPVGHVGMDDAPSPGIEYGPQNSLGLFYFGNVQPNRASRLKWVFERFDDSPFYFSGRVVTLVEEICGDGIDNNCNNNIDEGCPVCGDGELDYLEQCDDGNQLSGDGCEPDCTILNCTGCLTRAITVDGSLEDWNMETEQLIGTGAANVKYLMAWDENYLYVAWREVNLNTDNIYLAIDQDPGPDPASGTEEFLGGVIFPGNRKPEYAIVFNSDDDIWYFSVTNGSWNIGLNMDSWSHYKGHETNLISELRIPRSYLGSMDPNLGFGLWTWANNNAENYVWSIWPDSNPISTVEGEEVPAYHAHYAQNIWHICGDGLRTGTEGCDDGNNMPGDGCSPGCREESCGDGILDPGEECDDGNEDSGDGCSLACQIDFCGNGEIDPGEECDGTLNESYICTNQCQISLCGNGMINETEECDDNNLEGGDGCSSDCLFEEDIDPNCIADCLNAEICDWLAPTGPMGETSVECWNLCTDQEWWNNFMGCLEPHFFTCAQEGLSDCLCNNGIQDESETDMDCGGAECDPCGAENSCLENHDCLSSVCEDSICQFPSCEDEIRNGDESDRDCGGSYCSECPEGFSCSSDADCISRLCEELFCSPTCWDEIKNNGETHMDCGGPNCEPCEYGSDCSIGDDCLTETCVEGICGCNEGLALCGFQCADLNSDYDNCGFCGQVCELTHGTGICDDGICKIDTCEEGWNDVNTNFEDGCEWRPLDFVVSNDADGNLTGGSLDIARELAENKGDLKVIYNGWSLQCSEVSVKDNLVGCQVWFPFTLVDETTQWAVSTTPEWWIATLNSTGLTDHSRWLIESHNPTANYIEQAELQWFGRDWRSHVYSHYSNGHEISGSLTDLITAVDNGAIITMSHSPTTILLTQNRTHLAALYPNHMSTAYNSQDEMLIQNDAYHFFHWMNVTGTEYYSRWNIGAYTNRGNNSSSRARDWFMEPGWQEVYAHNEYGLSISGNLNDLITAIVEGGQVRIEIDEGIFQNCDHISISEDRDRVQCSVTNSIGWSDNGNIEHTPIVYRNYFLIDSNGQNLNEQYRVGTGIMEGQSITQVPVRWFVSTIGWRTVLITGENGISTFGSVSDLLDEIEAGADVITMTSWGENDIVERLCEGIRFDRPSQRVACLYHSTELMLDGNSDPYHYFGVLNSNGVLRDQRIRMGTTQDGGALTRIPTSVKWVVRQ